MQSHVFSEFARLIRKVALLIYRPNLEEHTLFRRELFTTEKKSASETHTRQHVESGIRELRHIINS